MKTFEPKAHQPLAEYSIASLLVLALSLSACTSMMSQKEQFAEIDKKVDARDFSGAVLTLETSKDTYYSK